MTDPNAKRPRKPQLGEFLEAEALVNYLKRGHRRSTLTPYRDRITVNNGLGGERFDLVRVDEGVRWQRTR